VWRIPPTGVPLLATMTADRTLDISSADDVAIKINSGVADRSFSDAGSRDGEDTTPPDEGETGCACTRAAAVPMFGEPLDERGDCRPGWQYVPNCFRPGGGSGPWVPAANARDQDNVAY
jgi:hypothetical protein